MEYKNGEKYWFFENYNNTGRILIGKLIWRNKYNNVKVRAENGNYWYFSAKKLYDSKKTLLNSKENKLKKEKKDELSK